jgi:two-component system LytT family response regulator
MNKIIIVDNASKSRITLEKYLTENFSDKYVIVAICEDVNSAKKSIEANKPDLIFLETEIPNKDGFELLKEIKSVKFEVIFTTSHDKYAIKAIKTGALDYLIKPINLKDLTIAIRRFENKKIVQKSTDINLLETRSSNDLIKKIAFSTDTGYEFININSILYCEADSNYCRIFCIDGREIILAKTLKNIEQQLASTNLFHRIHKSYLVNLNYILRLNKSGSLEVELHNGIKIPVSFRQKENFLNAFKEVVEK